MCCLRYVGSFLGVFPSDLLPGHSIARSGTLIVNTDPHTESGSHWLATHPTHLTISIRTAYLHIFPPYNPSSDATARYGTTTRYSYRDLLVPSVANIAVSSSCTWTEVIRLNNSSDYLLQRPPTGWLRACSSRSLDLYEICLEEGSAAAVKLKRK